MGSGCSTKPALFKLRYQGKVRAAAVKLGLATAARSNTRFEKSSGMICLLEVLIDRPSLKDPVRRFVR